MTDYKPVECGLHSRFELAVMRGHPVLLSWMDNGAVSHIGTVRPVDLVTRSGEEFLVVIDAHGVRHDIRLDRIRQFDGNPATG